MPFNDEEPCYIVQSKDHLFIAPQDTVAAMLHLSKEKSEEVFNALCGVDGEPVPAYEVGGYTIGYCGDLWQLTPRIGSIQFS